ncbi:MAG: mechanosensitive ion channel family protein [Acidobacteriota bacterium]
MDRLTQLLGFDAGYVLYPFLALVVAGIARFIIRRILRRWAEKTENRVDDRIVATLDGAVLPLLLIAVLYFVAVWLPLSDRVTSWIQRGLTVVGIGLLFLLAFRIISMVLESAGEKRAGLKRFLHPLRTLSSVLLGLVWVAVSLKVLRINLTEDGVRLVRIVGILVGSYVVLRIIGLAVVQMQRLVEDQDESTVSEAEKRAKTLGNIIRSAGFVLVIGVAIMMVLSELGVDITPIITGAGIAGLALGFGAQNLVRDVISGFFLILEDQIRVGDVASINGTGGFVESIRLRTIVLRDLEGVVHIFPNGEIKQVSNRTKEWSRYVIDVGVAYKEDVDRVMEVLKQIGEELSQDPNYASLILNPLEILGVDDFGDSQVTIKIMIKTLPLKQWVVGRELRRRIKNTFDQKGIEIPFPHVSVYFGEASKPFDLAMQPPSVAPSAELSARS